MDSLYDLSAQYIELMNMGEIPEEELECWNDTLEAISDEIEIKADSYAKILQVWEARSLMLKAEIDRLSAKKKALENSKDRLKKSLENAMVTTGKTKFKTDLFSFGIQKNPASVVLDPELDVNSIPAEFLKFADPIVDKSAVKEALKSGAELDWARLEQTEGLRIR